MDIIKKGSPVTISQHGDGWWAETVIDETWGAANGVAIEFAWVREPVLILTANWPVLMIAIIEEAQEQDQPR